MHKPEDEVAVRKMFEETPGLVANKILDLKKAVPTKESGETHSNKGEETDDPVETANELRMITGRLPRRA